MQNIETNSFQPRNLLFYPFYFYGQPFQGIQSPYNTVFFDNTQHNIQYQNTTPQNYQINHSQQNISPLQKTNRPDQNVEFKAKTFSPIKNKKKDRISSNISKQRSQRPLTLKNLHQTQNRNVISNIFRNFSRRLYDTPKIAAIVDKIIKQRNLNIKTRQFFHMIKKLKIDHSKYIRVGYIKYLLNDHQNPSVSLVLRILFDNYIRSQGLVQALTSHKLKGQALIHHLQGFREIAFKVYKYN